jgi:alpha-tubulin suppressor-like RCC1 family protein
MSIASASAAASRCGLALGLAGASGLPADSQPHAIRAVSRRGALATLFFLVAGCVGNGPTPSVPRLLGATILSAAGMPPKRPDFYETPVRVSETLKFTAITAGADHTCAIEVGGDTYCWGSNQYEQLGSAGPTETCGSGVLACSSSPVRLQDAPRFTALAASIWSTCGLDASGGVHCWGFGLGGRRGDPLPASSGMPVEVPGDHVFVALTSGSGGNRTCGLTLDGHAWCWGLSADGTVGPGPPRVFAGPDRVAASTKFTSISFGGQHGCGIDAALDVSCWGSNQFGQLGIGSSALDGGIRESSVPVAVHGELKLNRIVAGPGYSCGLHTEGSAYCWGLSFALDSSTFSRAPDRRSIPHGSLPVPLETTGPKGVSLAAGTTQACVLSVDGELSCFATTPAPRRDRRPIRIESDETFVAFAVGANHACAIGADAAAYCWGSSHAGQAGRSPSGR